MWIVTLNREGSTTEVIGPFEDEETAAKFVFEQQLNSPLWALQFRPLLPPSANLTTEIIPTNYTAGWREAKMRFGFEDKL
jgi:hypothetical protein